MYQNAHHPKSKDLGIIIPYVLLNLSVVRSLKLFYGHVATVFLVDV